MGDRSGRAQGNGVVGGKLYTSDIDQLVEINIASGAVSNRYPAKGAMSILAQDPMLMGVNGLTLAGNMLIVADLGDASQGFDKIKPGYVVRIDLTTKAITAYGSADPSGVLDGVEPDGAGGILITDNMGGRLLQQAPGAAAAEVAKLESSAADLEVVPDQNLIVVPITSKGTLVGLIWANSAGPVLGSL